MVTPVVSSPTPAPPVRTLEPAPVAAPQSSDDDLVTRVRKLLAESDGQPLGRRMVAKRLGITEHQARTALDLVAATAGPVLNGTGGKPRPSTSSRNGP
jgi:phage-related baseplate assembly protein